MIRVLIVDDHAVVREGLRLLLETLGEFSVVADTADGRAAIELARQLRPDVVVMDFAMNGMNGADATRLVREACPEVRVVMLSAYGSHEHVAHALEAGASGYVLKESAGREVAEAIRVVRSGRRFLSSRLNAAEIDLYLRRTTRPTSSPFALLSPREREVLQAIAEGRTNAEVAEALGVSVKTIETHRARIMDKLGVTTFADLVKISVQHGVTPPTMNPVVD